MKTHLQSCFFCTVIDNLSKDLKIKKDKHNKCKRIIQDNCCNFSLLINIGHTVILQMVKAFT